jgi:hypothetical protein
MDFVSLKTGQSPISSAKWGAVAPGNESHPRWWMAGSDRRVRKARRGARRARQYRDNGFVYGNAISGGPIWTGNGLRR